MNLKQKRKFIGIVSILLIAGIATSLVLYALKQNINLFVTPTQLMQTKINTNQIVRIGGYVKNKSVVYDPNGKHISFIVTDKTNDLTVDYTGVLPNLFREGQGVVVTGKLNQNHILLADQVLAKHDEKYMPPILKKALESGDNHAT